MSVARVSLGVAKRSTWEESGATDVNAAHKQRTFVLLGVRAVYTLDSACDVAVVWLFYRVTRGNNEFTALTDSIYFHDAEAAHDKVEDKYLIFFPFKTTTNNLS